MVTIRHFYFGLTITGKELDDSTGLYYYGSRYYDPVLGRFITPDTIVQSPYDPQSLNRYAYCRNNPLRYVDPTGNEYWPTDGQSSHSDWVYNSGLAGSDAGCWGGRYSGGAYALGIIYGLNQNPYFQSVSAFSEGFLTGLYETPIGVVKLGYGLVTDPVETVKGIPEGFKFMYSELTSGDPERQSDMIGSIGVSIMWMKVAKDVAKAKGVTKTKILPKNVAKTFKSGKYRSTVLKSDANAFRYFDGVNAKEFGSYLTTKSTTRLISGSESAQSVLNLGPSGNLATNMTKFTIPKGTRVFIGRIEGGAARATQIFIENPGLLIK